MRIDSSAPKGLSKFNILASAALAVMLADAPGLIASPTIHPLKTL
jgi:hypothetical protein